MFYLSEVRKARVLIAFCLHRAPSNALYFSVADPKLSKQVYGQVLETMMEEMCKMRTSQESSQGKTADFISKAEEMFLNVVTGWGPTNFLKEHIRYCKYDCRNETAAAAIKDAEYRFANRFTQSSACYLDFPVERGERRDGGPEIQSEGYFDSKRSLFDVDELIRVVKKYGDLESNLDSSAPLSAENNTRIALDAMTRLYMMKGQYDDALRCFISIGALHAARPLADFKAGAVDYSTSVGSRQVDQPSKSENGVPYTFLLDIIDSHHLQQCLLDGHFLSNSNSKKVVPIFSLLQLVGFKAMGDFLIEHCVPPQVTESMVSRDHSERRGTLPLDLVAAQLEGSPRILHWYLRLVFIRKPETYVRFPNSVNPPRAVAELHRVHFGLHVDFAGEERNSADALAGIEAYKVSSLETRFLQFLKVRSACS